MKKIGFLCVLFFVGVLVLSGCVKKVDDKGEQMANGDQSEVYNLESLKVSCEESGAKWLGEFTECENVNKDWCNEKGGDFNECASACRHETDEFVVCTMQCVLVCSFEINGKSSENGMMSEVANPASQYCVENGGKVEIKDSLEGQYGLCVFDDGSLCEEWSYMRGKCKPGTVMVDLTNCETYFDGCNNCMVSEDWMLACTRKYCAPEDTGESKCLKFKEQSE